MTTACGCGRRKYGKHQACVSCRRRCSCGGMKADPFSASCRACSDASKRGTYSSCAHCGAQFIRPNRGRHDARRCCSRACGFAYLRATRAAARLTRTAVMEAARERSRQKACTFCGALFYSASRRASCSTACDKALARRYARTSKINSKPRISRTCQRCRATFTPPYGSKRRTYCSRKCSRAAAKRGGKSNESRARRAGVPLDYSVDRIAVFNRDGWRCQICGCSAPKRLNGTVHPNAPELDHIVPISRGGGHVWSNVQCACRSCNQSKGDNVLGQLRLPA